MLAKIKQKLRDKPLESLDGLLDVMNREFSPVLRAVRDAINAALGDETRLPLVRMTYDPIAGTSASYQVVDALSPTVMTGAVFSDGDFPETLNDRTRTMYFRVLGGMVGASSSVSFVLYDFTLGAQVAGSEITMDSADLSSSEVGPLELVDGHSYIVMSKRADGTADALVAEAEIVARYE